MLDWMTHLGNHRGAVDCRRCRRAKVAGWRDLSIYRHPAQSTQAADSRLDALNERAVKLYREIGFIALAKHRNSNRDTTLESLQACWPQLRILLQRKRSRHCLRTIDRGQPWQNRSAGSGKRIQC